MHTYLHAYIQYIQYIQYIKYVYAKQKQAFLNQQRVALAEKRKAGTLSADEKIRVSKQKLSNSKSKRKVSARQTSKNQI